MDLGTKVTLVGQKSDQRWSAKNPTNVGQPLGPLPGALPELVWALPELVWALPELSGWPGGSFPSCPGGPGV